MIKFEYRDDVTDELIAAVVRKDELVCCDVFASFLKFLSYCDYGTDLIQATLKNYDEMFDVGMAFADVILTD